MFVFQFHPEHGIGQRFQHRCHNFNRVFFTHLSPWNPLLRDPSLCSGFRLQAPASLTPARRLNFNRVFFTPSTPWLAASLYSVSTRVPFFVTATVCSKWALKLPSSVTAVHLSASTRAPGLPMLTIGSMASTMPSRRRAPCPRVPKFGTCGSSCSLVPIPCPTNSRTTLKPLASTYSCTAAPTSPTVLPSFTSSMPFLREASVTSSSFFSSGASDLPTGTVIAESP